MRTYAILCVFALLTIFGVSTVTAQTAANSQARLAEIEQDLKTTVQSGVFYSFSLETQDFSSLNQTFQNESSIRNFFYKEKDSGVSTFLVLTVDKNHGVNYLGKLLKSAGFPVETIKMIR